MIRNIASKITKRTRNNILLGRWSTISSENNKVTEKKFKRSIDFNIDSANHDHCGSELCNEIKNKKNYKFFEDEEMFPYII
tara:strand:+ start:323 stop:565 length:243 start_codon:yes stop_codon:yes gene_type:complete